MKRTAILILLFIGYLQTGAQQNLVPNPSFEDTVFCPIGLSLLTGCVSWRQYTDATSDYLHSCSYYAAGVPNNWIGYQYAASGNAYCGVIANVNTWAEYIAAELSQKMIVNRKYKVEMSVNLGNQSGYATNNLGVYFYDSNASYVFTSNILPYIPQISYAKYGVINDTLNWVRLVDTLVADSAYDNIVIGPFNVDGNSFTTDTLGGGSWAYYYIDSVVVSLIDTFVVAVQDSILCAGDTLSVDFVAEKPLGVSNIFRLQLSDKYGGFNSPINIDSLASDSCNGMLSGVIPLSISPGSGYRIRVTSTVLPDTSLDNGFDISIGNLDSANIIVTSTSSPLCEYDTLHLSASSSVTAILYNWMGPNGFNANVGDTTILNVDIAYTGTYYSTVNVYGCTVRDTFDVVVKQSPDSPNVTNNTPLCEGDTLRLYTATGTNGVTFSWAGPGGFSSSSDTIILLNTVDTISGIYTATVSKNGCSTSDTTNVIVKTRPFVTLSNNNPLCTGDTLKLNSTAFSTGVTYSWSGPMSFSSNTQNATRVNATPNMSGWYKMLVNLNGCEYTDSTQAFIYTIPIISSIGGNNPICIGDTLKLTTGNYSGATYSWTGPNNFSSSQRNPTRANISLADAGAYRLTIAANGCVSPQDSVNVSVNPQPFVVILANKDSICAGGSVTFTALPNNVGGTPTYQWFVNAQYVAGGSTVFTTSTLNHNDVIRCDMTEYTKCANNFTDPSNDVQIAVLPWLAPSVSITSNPSGPVKEGIYIDFTATTVNAGKKPQYQWKRNGTDVIGAQSNIWSANNLNDNDSISVEIVSNYLCPLPTTAVSNGIKVHILTSVGDIEGAESLVLYPNPNNGKFILSGKLPNGRYDVLISNSIGQKVFSGVTEVQGNVLQTEMQLNVAVCMYILQLRDEAGHRAIIRFEVK
ncbi:MAG: hypothetical protein H6551_12735 [Chitinophagales bacterium]|nr:hypothetical protein [Chitinophagaceae bacterium]MCB9065998.1 hypothetical protein [Chitinophagales bacterium]